jgi:hypothetical protein
MKEYLLAIGFCSRIESQVYGFIGQNWTRILRTAEVSSLVSTMSQATGEFDTKTLHRCVGRYRTNVSDLVVGLAFWFYFSERLPLLVFSRIGAKRQ